jgi:hypothetical protein
MYRNRHGDDYTCFQYAADAPVGDVVLSDEHTAYEWMSPGAYVARYCADPGEGAPSWVRVFLEEMRHNCQLVLDWCVTYTHEE